MPSLREAMIRHCRHYLATLRAIGDLGQQGGDDLVCALCRFEAELPQIDAARAWADANLEADREAATLCQEFPFAGETLLDFRLTPRQVARWLKGALAAARRGIDSVAETRCLALLAKCYLATGEVSRAMDCLEHCFMPRTLGADGLTLEGFIREPGGTDALRHLLLNNLGLAYEQLGYFDRALQCHERALALSRVAGRRPDEALAMINLGKVDAALGSPDHLRRALELFNASRTLAQTVGDRRLEAIALANLGMTALRLGDADHALRRAEEALKIAREIGDRRRQCEALATLASALERQGAFGLVLQAGEEALTLAREIGDRALEAARLGSIGFGHLGLGSLDRAVEYFRRQAVLAHEIGDRREEVNALGNLGVAYAKLGDAESATQCCEQHLALAAELGARRAESSALPQVAITFNELGGPGYSSCERGACSVQVD